jgi:hypothetical protein
VFAAFFATLLPDLLVALFGDGVRGIDLVVNAALLVYTIARHPTGLAGAVVHAEAMSRAFLSDSSGVRPSSGGRTAASSSASGSTGTGSRRVGALMRGLQP